MTQRLTVSLIASVLGLALALPAAASPQCGDEKDKKDEEKNPSAAPQCGDEKDGKKDEEKNPSAAPLFLALK